VDQQFNQLLSRYEQGLLTRRELLTALSAMAIAAQAAPAEAQPAIGQVKQLNHVTVFVPDVQKSVAFYQALFGMPVLTRQDPGINLNAGNGFFGIYPAQAGQSRIDHVCLGLDNFDAEAVVKQLAERGVKGTIRLRGDTKEVYFTDPDNLRIQLQDVKYKGGVGPLGDRDPG
jgi:catechol 2,3-dioxygenase-like lactoylglutathione lyase family enzyme